MKVIEGFNEFFRKMSADEKKIFACKLYRPRRNTSHGALQWFFLRLCPLNRRKYQTDTSGYK